MKVGVPGDSPIFRNPPKSPHSDSDLHSTIASPLVLETSPQAPPAASVEARAVVHLEAPPMADVVPEAL